MLWGKKKKQAVVAVEGIDGGLVDAGVELEAVELCRNCSAPLTGTFCTSCGQKHDDWRRPFHTFLADFAENTLSLDGRVFKSLAVLISMPGRLTLDYMEGRRMRYTAPLRLYVATTILFFLLVWVLNIAILDIRFTLKEEVEAANDPATLSEAVTPNGGGINMGSMAQSLLGGIVGDALVFDPEDSRSNAEILAEVEANLADNDDLPPGMREQILKQVRDALAQREAIIEAERAATEQARESEQVARSIAPAAPGDAETGVPDSAQAGNRHVEEAERGWDGVNIEFNTEDDEEPAQIRINPEGVTSDDDLDGFPYDVSVEAFVFLTEGERTGLRQEHIDRIMQDDEDPAFLKEALRGFERGLEDPARFNALFNDWIPRIMIVLVPVFALMLRLTHWGKKRFYMHQLVFSLHYHSFMFILMSVFAVTMPYLGGAYAGLAFWLITSLYFVVALKVAEQQGWMRAFFKAGFIYVGYALLLSSALAYGVVEGLREL